jgi:hypothetical protein
MNSPTLTERRTAKRPEHGAPFPNVRSDDELRAKFQTGVGWQYGCVSTVFKPEAVARDRTTQYLMEQLALIAVDKGPLVIAIALLRGTIVATAAKGYFSSAKLGGKYSAHTRSSVLPCKRLGQNSERAMSAIPCQPIPDAAAAPIMLPTLVPAKTVGRMPTSSRALITPMWAKPRTPPPPSARPIFFISGESINSPNGKW